MFVALLVGFLLALFCSVSVIGVGFVYCCLTCFCLGWGLNDDSVDLYWGLMFVGVLWVEFICVCGLIVCNVLDVLIFAC